MDFGDYYIFAGRYFISKQSVFVKGIFQFRHDRTKIIVIEKIKIQWSNTNCFQCLYSIILSITHLGVGPHVPYTFGLMGMYVYIFFLFLFVQLVQNLTPTPTHPPPHFLLRI